MSAFAGRGLYVLLGAAAAAILVIVVDYWLSEQSLDALALAERPLRLPAFTTLRTIHSIAVALGAVAIVLVWRRCDAQGRPQRVVLPVVLWLVAMSLDVTFSYWFHGLQRYDLALATAGVWVVVAIVGWRVIRRIDKLAGWLILTILVWLLYAFSQAHRFWQLNPAL